MKQNNFPEPDIPVDVAWKEMKSLIDNSFTTNKQSKYSKSNILKPTAYFGISLFIVLGIVYFVFFQQQTKQKDITVFSQNKCIKDTLLTGDIVFLNKFSSIITTTDNNKGYIIKILGSAFFDSISTGNNLINYLSVGSVKVFPKNASIYTVFDSTLKLSKIYVKSGSVEIKIDDKYTTLLNNESLFYNEKTKTIETKKQIDLNLFSYASKNFEFSNTPINEAIRLIENAYNVTFKLENPTLNYCRITTKFDNKSLTEILDIISYTLNLEYQFNEKDNSVKLYGNGCEK